MLRFQIIKTTTDSKHVLVRQKPKLSRPGECGYSFVLAAPPCVATNSTLLVTGTCQNTTTISLHSRASHNHLSSLPLDS